MTATSAEVPEPTMWLVPALRDMLAVLALIAAVWLVHVYGRVLPTAALAAIWTALAALITAALFRRARIRRQAFLTAYLQPQSAYARRLRGGWVMAARAAVLGAGLALFVGIALVRLDEPAAWIVLVAAGPALVLVQRLLSRALASHANDFYLPELAWRLNLAAVGAAMLAALVWLAFHRPYPELGAVSLDRAVWHLVDQERARSDGGLFLLQLAAAKDALRLWLAQQLMPQPGTSLAQAAGWLVVLAEEALFVWSYLLMCSGVLIGIKRK